MNMKIKEGVEKLFLVLSSLFILISILQWGSGIITVILALFFWILSAIIEVLA